MEEKDLDVHGENNKKDSSSKNSTDDVTKKDAADKAKEDIGKVESKELKSDDSKDKETQKQVIDKDEKSKEVDKEVNEKEKLEDIKEKGNDEKTAKDLKEDKESKAKDIKDEDNKESIAKASEDKEEAKSEDIKEKGNDEKTAKDLKEDKESKAKDIKDEDNTESIEKVSEDKEEAKPEDIKEGQDKDSVEKTSEASKEESKDDSTDSNKSEKSESDETPGEEEIQNKKKKSKKLRIYAASIVGLGLAVTYFGGVHYFRKRFLPNTTINYTDASYASLDEFDAKLQEPLSSYSLEIIAREGEKHVIRAKDVDLHYKPDDSIKLLLSTQDVYRWPMYLFKENPLQVPVSVELDDNKLEYILSNYDCLTESKFKEARDAYIADYTDSDGYVIEKEYDGTRIDIPAAKEKIKSSLTELALVEDLDADNLYDFAKIKDNDAKLLSAQEVLNKHVATVINYAGGAVLNGERISQWIGVDDEGNLILDEAGIRTFVDELSEKYDTLGKPRLFKTTDAREVEVPAKKYGWQVDKEGEFQAIKASILAGEQIEREPVFASRAVSLEGNDFGNTYVEIDLGNQKLYYYVDGQLTLSSDIVSGALWGGRRTPEGLYKVNYKARNVVLRGPNYAAPVRYWMPFNGGIGMHDANWRSSFGGGIYKSGGSHGCINMPSSSAKALYDSINKDCPVICYY